MPEYRAPLADMRFAMQELAGLDSLTASIPAFETLNSETADAILEEAGRMAAKILSPLNRSGDRDGVKLEQGQVRVAPGFAQAYREFAAGGWVGLTGSPEYGGPGTATRGGVARGRNVGCGQFVLCTVSRALRRRNCCA